MDQVTAYTEVFVDLPSSLAAAAFAWKEGNSEVGRATGLCMVQKKEGGWMTAASAHAWDVNACPGKSCCCCSPSLRSWEGLKLCRGRRWLCFWGLQGIVLPLRGSPGSPVVGEELLLPSPTGAHGAGTAALPGAEGPLLPAGAAPASGEDASRSSTHIGKWAIALSGAGCKSFMFLPDLGFLAKVVVRVHANGHPEGGTCQLMSTETFFPVCVYGVPLTLLGIAVNSLGMVSVLTPGLNMVWLHLASAFMQTMLHAWPGGLLQLGSCCVHWG